jgi:PIN domain nuclease of toxin-antitoxin system
VLDRWQVSAVNLAEVVSKAIDHGGTMEVIPDMLALIPLGVIPFAPEDALSSGSLGAATRAYGLSLGGRCFLALGLKTGHPHVSDQQQKASYCGRADWKAPQIANIFQTNV